MKKWLYCVLIVVAVLFGLTFSYKNHQIITINYYFGVDFQIELSLLIFIIFCLGVLIGYVAMLFSAIRTHRKLLHAKKQIRTLQRPTLTSQQNFLG